MLVWKIFSLHVTTLIQLLSKQRFDVCKVPSKSRSLSNLFLFAFDGVQLNNINVKMFRLSSLFQHGLRLLCVTIEIRAVLVYDGVVAIVLVCDGVSACVTSESVGGQMSTESYGDSPGGAGGVGGGERERERESGAVGHTHWQPFMAHTTHGKLFSITSMCFS